MSPQRLLLLALLLYIAWRLVRSLIREKITQEAKDQLWKKSKQADETTVQDILVEDPVCHTLLPKHQAIRLRQNGKTYYFCSDSCCDQFTGEPGGKE
ncbi:MAG: YHS domain-containing protein [Candidatus Electrothrix sp. GW3-4]|uniref:YHS domain-containing protein n=1 Tax=Candidatus Electrothrix sp. GW3-4 TaxID=3126740 RepID=UPI0030CB5BE6